MNEQELIPRRNRLDLNTSAEVSIYNAMQEVEKVGVDARLTDAVILLQKARDLVADYVDGVNRIDFDSDKVKAAIEEAVNEQQKIMERKNIDSNSLNKEFNV